jgi:ribonuclease HI
MFPKINICTKNKNVSNSVKIFPEIFYKLNFDGRIINSFGTGVASAVIYRYDEEYWSDNLAIENIVNCNTIEYAGLLLGLNKAVDLGIKNLKVESSSNLVINQMKEIYDCKSPDLVEIYTIAKNLEKNFDYIEYLFISKEKNNRAAELCNEISIRVK